MKLDTKLIPKLIQEKFDLVKSLYNYNSSGRYTYGQPTFCPFHDNTDTPAAALYQGKDGHYDSLYCFAEQKQYTVVDVLGKLMGYNIYEVGHAIWNEMTPTEKQMFLNEHNRRDSLIAAFGSDTVTLNENKVDHLEILNNFRLGRATLFDSLQTIIDGRKAK